MKKILNLCLSLFSTAVATICLCIVSVATGTISFLGPYEPEMPVVLRPNDNEKKV